MQKTIKSADGTKISYSISRKSKKFVIFLHGLGGDGNAWRKIAGYFSRIGYSTVAPDLRGHGLSGRPNNPEMYKLENFARDIHELILHEKIRDYFLVAHCFGGAVAAKHSELYPNSASGYVLISTTYRAPRSLRLLKAAAFTMNQFLAKLPTKKGSRRNFDRFIGTNDWSPRRILSDITSTSLRSWLYTYQKFAEYDGREALKKINAPTLVIVGKNDTIFRPEKSSTISRLVKGAIFRAIPGQNHIIVINSPEIIQKEIGSFLTSIGFASPGNSKPPAHH